MYILSNVYHYKKHLHGSHSVQSVCSKGSYCVCTKQCVSLQEALAWKPFSPRVYSVGNDTY